MNGWRSLVVGAHHSAMHCSFEREVFFFLVDFYLDVSLLFGYLHRRWGLKVGRLVSSHSYGVSSGHDA